MPSAPGTPPRALDDSGLRHVVTVLAVTQITSWGVLYYAFAALSSSITSETGWSTVAVTGAFSTSQLVSAGAGVWVGRHIDAFGPRHVMTAGSLLSVPGVLLLATAPNLVLFYAGWVVVGLAMSGVLYPPAFAALTHWAGDERVRALTTLTLVAGLASTVFAPLAAWLDDWQGWRWTYVILLALQVVVTVPLHWWGLRHPWGHASRSPLPAHGHGPTPTASVARSRPFILLTVAMAMAALAVFAVVINLVPMLVEQGLSRNLAAVALGLGGVGQVAGRLGFARLARHTTATTRTVLVVLGIGLATAALALAPGDGIALVALSMLVGLTRGLYTLIQATAVTDRWGPAGYGTLNGILTAPSLIAGASAPFVGAALAEGLGSFSAAFLVIAGVAVTAALLAALAAPASPYDAAGAR